MWCANCQADVAAEVYVDHRRIRCACCSSDLGESNVSRLSATTRNAREILERWSNSGLVDPFGPTTDLATPDALSESDELPFTAIASSVQTTSHSEEFNAVTNAESKNDAERHAHVTQAMHGEFLNRQRDVNTADSKPTDAESQTHSTSGRVETDNRVESVRTGTRSVTDTGSNPESKLDKSLRADAPVGSPPGPHFDVQHAIQQRESRTAKADWGSGVGQWLAYLGVLVLTVGTCVVVYGYFGAKPGYTPTGWLVMTFGQMLLFLGIISLVSGGIEQSSAEVSRQVGQLGEQLSRLEYAARFGGQDVTLRSDHPHSGMAGPHFSPVGSPSPHERHVVERQTR